jgi:hypothetical protein
MLPESKRGSLHLDKRVWGASRCGVEQAQDSRQAQRQSSRRQELVLGVSQNTNIPGQVPASAPSGNPVIQPGYIYTVKVTTLTKIVDLPFFLSRDRSHTSSDSIQEKEKRGLKVNTEMRKTSLGVHQTQ